MSRKKFIDLFGKNKTVEEVAVVYQEPSGVFDDQGDLVFPDQYAQTFTYSGGLVQTAAFTNGSNTWTQTYSYTGSDVTGISLWVKS